MTAPGRLGAKRRLGVRSSRSSGSTGSPGRRERAGDYLLLGEASPCIRGGYDLVLIDTAPHAD